MMTVPFEKKSKEYAQRDALVSTTWVAENLGDPSIRVMEGSGDALLYEHGHIPGAINLDWKQELHDPIRRDIVCKEAFEALIGGKGIDHDSMIVLYGDQGNCYAAFGFWVFKLYGHRDVRIMDGGRLKWEKEGLPWTREVPICSPSRYHAEGPNLFLRAYRDEVFRQMEAKRPMLDVRSVEEYRGEVAASPGGSMPAAQRSGHIPGARNVPWSWAIDPEDGAFWPAEQLRAKYPEDGGIECGEDVITYCHIGERSSHTWFVLTYLLGHPSARNYDGSWAEWGNLIAAPVER